MKKRIKIIKLKKGESLKVISKENPDSIFIITNDDMLIVSIPNN